MPQRKRSINAIAIGAIKIFKTTASMSPAPLLFFWFFVTALAEGGASCYIPPGVPSPSEGAPKFPVFVPCPKRYEKRKGVCAYGSIVEAVFPLALAP